MEWFSVAAVEPDWDYLQIFYFTDFIPGLDADAKSNAHPLIRTDVNSPANMSYISSIIYQKGSTVLRMFEYILTTDKFFDAIHRYLQGNAFTTVLSPTLLDTLATVPVDGLIEGPNGTVREFLYSWTTQAGIPYVNITLSSGSGTTTRVYNIVQERFFANGIRPEGEEKR